MRHLSRTVEFLHPLYIYQRYDIVLDILSVKLIALAGRRGMMSTQQRRRLVSFSDLPTELRCMIYSIAIDDHCAADASKGSGLFSSIRRRLLRGKERQPRFLQQAKAAPVERRTKSIRVFPAENLMEAQSRQCGSY
jgi:hypothetical protein